MNENPQNDQFDICFRATNYTFEVNGIALVMFCNYIDEYWHNKDLLSFSSIELAYHLNHQYIMENNKIMFHVPLLIPTKYAFTYLQLQK